MLFPISCVPWGGTCPEAYAEVGCTSDEIRIRMWCLEAEPRVTCTQPNSAVYLDSCLEVFLNPFPAFSGDYLNFEMNAAGALLLQKGPDRAHRQFVSLTLPDYPKVQAWRKPEAWGVELNISFRFLRQVYGENAPPCPQDPLGNFYQCSGPPQERYGCWHAPASDYPDFHRPESFMPVPMEIK